MKTADIIAIVLNSFLEPVSITSISQSVLILLKKGIMDEESFAMFGRFLKTYGEEADPTVMVDFFLRNEMEETLPGYSRFIDMDSFTLLNDGPVLFARFIHNKNYFFDNPVVNSVLKKVGIDREYADNVSKDDLQDI